MMRSPRELILSACVVLLLAGCGMQEQANGKPNVILILVDTLRADHLSLTGYHRQTSPSLDALAERGTYFRDFYAHSAITRPSVATLFTSRYVSNHGVVNRGFGRLSQSLPVIAEILQRHGYHSIAAVTNPQVHPRMGFARGFDEFTSLFSPTVNPNTIQPSDLVKTPAAEAFDAARRSIRDTPKPFFAYIHLLDPHGPYAQDERIPRLFTDPGYTGPITGSLQDFNEITRSGLADGPDLEHFRSLYDAEIAAADRAIGDFVAWLDAKGLSDNTHLLVTGDHGEEFMEHGGTGHGSKLYEETVRVPLLWVGPDVPRGYMAEGLAGLIDIAPTIIDVLGLTEGAPPLHGRSLQPLWNGGAPAEWRAALLLEGPDRGTVERKGRKVARVVRSVVSPTVKIVAHNCVLGEPDWESLEILDLTADPDEQQPRLITKTEPMSEADLEVVGFFEAAVAGALGSGARHSVDEVELPEEDVEKLRSLGYLE